MRSVIFVLAIAAVLGLVVLIILLITKRKPENTGSTTGGSYFDGNTLQYIGYNILSSLITALSLGIAYPWAVCMLERWKAKHTVINGRRLVFTGRGIQLFGNYILWWFLTIITLGIYSIWLGVNLEKWKKKHTAYADGKYDTTSEFTAGAGGWFVNHLVFFLINLLSLGLAYPWAKVRLMKWKAEHTVIGGSPLVFTGTGGMLFVKNLLCVLLTPITLGIYLLMYPVVLLKWEFQNTHALYQSDPIRKLSRAHEESAVKDYAKIRLAANDTELAAVKSGFTGNETPDELKTLAESGNSFASYALALRTKGEASSFEGEALALLKQASDSGYHAAMFDYSFYIEDPAEKTALLEESVKKGNAKAPWLLKSIYEANANVPNENTKLDNLTKAVYWFKVAIELENSEALACQSEYEDLLERLAILHCKRRPAPKSSGTAAVVGIAVGAVAVIAILGFIAATVLGVELYKRPNRDLGHVDRQYVGAIPWEADKAEVIRIMEEYDAACDIEYDIFYEETDEVDEGKVYRLYVDGEQYSPQGFAYYEGCYVKIVIAKSKAQLGFVHNLFGVDEQKAVAALEDEGFRVEVQYQKASDAEAGTVIAQSDHDIELEKGSTITIVVGKAAEKQSDLADILGSWDTAWREDDRIFFRNILLNDDGTFEEYSHFWVNTSSDGDANSPAPIDGWYVPGIGAPLYYGNYTLNGDLLILNFTHFEFGDIEKWSEAYHIDTAANTLKLDGQPYFQNIYSGSVEEIVEKCGVDTSTSTAQPTIVTEENILGQWRTAWREDEQIYFRTISYYADGSFSDLKTYWVYWDVDIGWFPATILIPENYGSYTINGDQLTMQFTHSEFGDELNEVETYHVQVGNSCLVLDGRTYYRGSFSNEEIVEKCGVDTSV